MSLTSCNETDDEPFHKLLAPGCRLLDDRLTELMREGGSGDGRMESLERYKHNVFCFA